MCCEKPKFPVIHETFILLNQLKRTFFDATKKLVFVNFSKFYILKCKFQLQTGSKTCDLMVETDASDSYAENTPTNVNKPLILWKLHRCIISLHQ